MKNLLSALLLISIICFSNAQTTNQPHPLTEAAKLQIGQTISYDPSYTRLAYPGGDIPIHKGVCTDVVIRALRKAYNMDLQKLVHEDMKHNFKSYPNLWNLKKTDRNIDHRRVPNLRTFFKRKGYSIPIKNKEFTEGDIITCLVGNRPHIMIISNKVLENGVPLIIHNIGSGTKEEDRLHSYKITGHYRITL